MAYKIIESSDLEINNDYRQYLKTLVWKDEYGNWRISQSTKEEALLKKVTNHRGISNTEFKIFNENEYAEATKYRDIKIGMLACK